MSVVLTLDVGGSSVKSGLIDESFRLVGTFRETAIDSQAPTARVIEDFLAVAKTHLAAIPFSDCEGLAIGFPGPFDYVRGVSRIQGLAKFEQIYGLNVGEALRAGLPGFDRPIRFGPDAEMGILGEANHGSGRFYQRLIGIGLGTGLGSAFIAAGAVVRQGPGVPPNGHLYPLPWRGAMAEAAFSNRGLTQRLRQIGPAYTTPAAAADSVRAGNREFAAAFRAFGEELGLFLKPYVEGFGAEAILCLGGIARAHDLFFPAVQDSAGVTVLGSTAPFPPALLGLADFFRGRRSA